MAASTASARPNASIQLVNYWPDISLDEYINLKERVENRMVIADVTATGDDNVLTAKANDISYRKEQLRRLQEEVIELEDLKTGVSITDLGLNDFRMDLLNYVKTNGDLANAAQRHACRRPGRAGTRPAARRDLRAAQPQPCGQHQPAEPPAPLLPGLYRQDGEVIANHTEVKQLLDLVRRSCKGQRRAHPGGLPPVQSSTPTMAARWSAYSDLLSQAIRSMIDVKEEKDLDSLFSGGRTTALVDTIAGLDDFELIAFLVIGNLRARRENRRPSCAIPLAPPVPSAASCRKIRFMRTRASQRG